MSQHVTVSPNGAADRLAIREHVEALAHHVTVDGGRRRLMVASLFSERLLYVDWMDERALS